AGFTVPQMLPSLLINGVYTLLFVLAAWKVLPTTSIDAGFAATIGIRTNFVNLLLMAFVAASAVTAFESLGSIVVVAMFIVPAATARLLTNRLGTMIAWAIAVAAASAVVGNIAALQWNTNTAGMIAVAAGFQFALAVALAPQQGLVSAWLRRFSLNVRIAAEDIIGMLYRAEESAAQHESASPTLLHEPAEALRGFVGWLAIRRLMLAHEIHATAGGALELTNSGREVARSVVRSHRLWETYLGEQTELPLDHLHAPAERMEHFIGPQLQEQIAAELTSSDIDPHGREIPSESGWRRSVSTPSLPEVHRTVPVPRRLTKTVLPSRASGPVQMVVPHSAGFWRTMLAFSGPGLMVSVGYMDPGNWATDLAGGAQFGYTLLSVILISNFMAMLLQYLALKLGVVTGRDLAQACRDHYSMPVAIGLWILCELAIAACDLAEVIGSAIALNLLFGLPILAGVLLTAADVFVILFLQFKGFRYVEALVVMLIGLIGVCFGYEIIASHPYWLGVAKGLIPNPQIVTNPEMLYIAIGILGATVMPHNLYLHSSIIQTRAYDQSESGKAKAIKFATIDSTFALFLAFFINAAILVLACAAFHGSGHQDVADIRDAYQLLSPVLGASLASILFAVALLASGQNSTLTGTLAGQIVMEGFLHIHL
ncbi:MAG TPA: Nramp family divalent metal transporter, partial [Pirellulaceae bacterium]|nr:Nramp family divalent metal transporter [Pirellulaceae bacterium]